MQQNELLESGRFQVRIPDISDDDIRRAADRLGLPKSAFHGTDGLDPRLGILMSNDSMDIAACPGSGKTTLLVAKLAILAEKWDYRTRGLCVLSHTNVARSEIENILGNTSVGRTLLSYPHFIGTIHSFINEFLALPWLRSLGYKVNEIDTEICEAFRWSKLSYGAISWLARNNITQSDIRIVDANFNWEKKRGILQLGNQTNTYRGVQAACLEATRKGYYCYDDAFVWARDMLSKNPSAVDVIRDRFPFVFLDEVQDNSEDQSGLLHQIFADNGSAVVRQRLGDENQAIYSSNISTEAKTDKFPDSSIKMNIPNSHRFGQRIADLAAPLAIQSDGLKGDGPSVLLEASSSQARHTIFVFDDDNPGTVLSAYASILAETFSQKELRRGSFTAVGNVHNRNGDDNVPRHVGHYWPDYNPALGSKDPTPGTFVEYLRASIGRFESTDETHLAVNKLAEGIFRLVKMADISNSYRQTRNYHRLMLQLLEEHPDTRLLYQKIVRSYVILSLAPNEEQWDETVSKVREIAETIAGGALNSQESIRFLAWEDAPVPPVPVIESPRNRFDNQYQTMCDGKEVTIRVGSIHSVKGESHMATLVLETFWHRHNLEQLLPWLSGSKVGGQSEGTQQQTRLKIHYVAMTRPTHLVCLAMKKSTFTTDSGELDEDLMRKLKQQGWQFQILG